MSGINLNQRYRKVKYMPGILCQQNQNDIPKWIALWHHEQDISRLFLKISLKTVKCHTDYCSGKDVRICRAKWKWYILCIILRWKTCFNMNLLDACAVCFLKGKPPEFVDIFIENGIFAILCQLLAHVIWHKSFCWSNWVNFGFAKLFLNWMPGF